MHCSKPTDQVNIKDKHNLIPFVPFITTHNQILMPQGNLPLILNDPRDIIALDNALMRKRMIGVIEKNAPNHEVATGCLGRINTFSEQDDATYYVLLEGVCRFDTKSFNSKTASETFLHANYTRFLGDVRKPKHLYSSHLREKLFGVLGDYLSKNELEIEQKLLEETDNHSLINALAMACPFNKYQKNALLKEPNLKNQLELMTTFMEIDINSSTHTRSIH